MRADLTRNGAAYRDMPWELMEGFGPLLTGQGKTDRNGWFQIDGLLPGLKYRFSARDEVSAEIVYSSDDLCLESSRAKNLGELTGSTRPAKPAKHNDAP